MNANDPAFPLATVSDKNREEYVVHQFQSGMSLREYCAIKAMQGYLAGVRYTDDSEEDARARAKASVIQADALMSELNKKPKP